MGKYKVAIHYIHVTEVFAPSEDDAVSYARDEIHNGGTPEETNYEVELIDETD